MGAGQCGRDAGGIFEHQRTVEVLFAANESEFEMTVLVYTHLITPLALEYFFPSGIDLDM